VTSAAASNGGERSAAGGGSAPRHVAIIMDGNGRWAKKRGLPRVAGHRAGAEAVRRTLRAAVENGVEVLTLYAFSSENWRRSQEEVSDLKGLLGYYLERELDSLAKDITKINDAARVKWLSNVLVGLALLKNFDPLRAPSSLRIVDLLKKFDKSLGATGTSYGVGKDRRRDPWNFLFIAGMWFQDLFNYDFRRTEMCIIPYGTQMGEISFCAYNTGVGWRNVIEKMKANATVADWYKTRGRHPIYAKNQDLTLPTGLGTVVMPQSAIELEKRDAQKREEREERKRIRLNIVA